MTEQEIEDRLIEMGAMLEECHRMLTAFDAALTHGLAGPSGDGGPKKGWLREPIAHRVFVPGSGGAMVEKGDG